MNDITLIKPAVDVPLWIIYELNSIENNRCIPKYLTYLFYFSMMEMQVFGVCLLFLQIKLDDTKWNEILAYLCIIILSFIIWHSLLYQKKNLQPFIHHIRSHSLRMKIYPSKQQECLYKFLTLLIYMSPCLLTSLHVYTTEEGSYFKNLMYGYSVEGYKLGAFIQLFITYAFYAMYMKYPLIMVLAICVLLRHCGILLSQYDNYMKTIKIPVIPESCINTLRGYFSLIQTIHLLRNILSIPLFISLTSSLISLYTFVVYGLNKPEVVVMNFVEFSSNVSTGIISLCAITVYSARIPEYMLDIKTTVESIIDQCHFDDFRERRLMRLFKRIEKRRVVYFSAFGMIDMKRNFLLTAFGVLFTYGILISRIHLV
ncbi:hypothetical protein AVEN_70697-1 [Araneus ventricosus]|uniref:Gustatory receptor n=1 Tax=Araneus ventricosus TaxID=182803 RepID=A0A4Y2S5Q6_ARAVE|nr:hypothetical protein AVEN_70697-1 [Araneus ventricosus]